MSIHGFEDQQRKVIEFFFNPADFGLYRYKDLLLAEPNYEEARAKSNMPASSSSSTDPPSAKAQSIPKRLQNRPMSKMAAKQSKLRMEAQHYLTCIYKRVAGFFWISFFNPATGVTKVGDFAPGTRYTHLYARARSLFEVPGNKKNESLIIWCPYRKWVMEAPANALVHERFNGKTFYVKLTPARNSFVFF